MYSLQFVATAETHSSEQRYSGIQYSQIHVPAGRQLRAGDQPLSNHSSGGKWRHMTPIHSATCKISLNQEVQQANCALTKNSYLEGTTYLVMS